MKPLAEIVTNEGDRLLLANMENLALGRVILRLVEARSDELMREIKTRAKLGTEDVRADVRHKLGEIAGIEHLLARVEEAKELAAKPKGA
jgi:hypothetical protein